MPRTIGSLVLGNRSILTVINLQSEEEEVVAREVFWSNMHN